MSEAEYGMCDCCQKAAILTRKYYRYKIKCDCCVGDNHFHLIRHCKECTPRPPEKIKIVLENKTPIEE